MFSCVWLHFKKMFRKIFSGVWLCSWKYHRKHIFYLLLTFSHIFSAAKRIYNIIHSSIQTQTKPRKKIIKSGQIERRRKRERLLGSTRGCDRRESKIAIGAVLREIVIDAKARSRLTARSFSLYTSVSHSFSLSFSLCVSVSSSLCAFQFRKWFEGKIKTKIILQDQRTHFTVNESYFPFDPIFRTNQTPTFPENHFWNQFEAKTNEALNNLLMT